MQKVRLRKERTILQSPHFCGSVAAKAGEQRSNLLLKKEDATRNLDQRSRGAGFCLIMPLQKKDKKVKRETSASPQLRKCVMPPKAAARGGCLHVNTQGALSNDLCLALSTSLIQQESNKRLFFPLSNLDSKYCEGHLLQWIQLPSVVGPPATVLWYFRSTGCKARHL